MSLFPDLSYPSGFQYIDQVIDEGEERRLLEFLSSEQVDPVAINGYPGKRLIKYYGVRYDENDLRPSGETSPLPLQLIALKDSLATRFGLNSEPFVQALLNKYPQGSTIGWHRDRPWFGNDVIGVSLASACRMQLRLRSPTGFERAEVVLPPRSAYLLSGDSRWKWQHSIPAVDAERWSITFRSLRK